METLPTSKTSTMNKSLLLIDLQCIFLGIRVNKGKEWARQTGKDLVNDGAHGRREEALFLGTEAEMDIVTFMLRSLL